MIFKGIAGTLIATLIGLTGCASAPDMENSNSGFLSSYDQLKPVKGADSLLRFRAKGFDPHSYGSIEFAPTTVVISKALKEQSTFSLEKQQELAEYFAQKMTEEFGAMEKVGASDKVLKLRTAFTGITNAPEELAAWQYLPITFVATAGFQEDIPMMFVEFDAIDMQTNKSVSQAMQRIQMTTIDPEQLKTMGVEALKPEIDKAIKALRKQFDKTF